MREIIERGEVLVRPGIFTVEKKDWQSPPFSDSKVAIETGDPYVSLALTPGIEVGSPGFYQQLDFSLAELAGGILSVPTSCQWVGWEGKGVMKYFETSRGKTSFLFPRLSDGSLSAWMSVKRLLQIYGPDQVEFEDLSSPYQELLDIDQLPLVMGRLQEVSSRPQKIHNLASHEMAPLRLLFQASRMVTLKPGKEPSDGAWDRWLAKERRQVEFRQELVSLLVANQKTEGFGKIMDLWWEILGQFEEKRRGGRLRTERLRRKMARQVLFIQKITKRPEALVEEGIFADREFLVMFPTPRQGLSVDLWLLGADERGEGRLVGVLVKRNPSSALALRQFWKTPSQGQEKSRLLEVARRARDKWEFWASIGLMAKVG